jgi:PilZ domain
VRSERELSAATKSDLERRRWSRLALAVPVFVRGMNGRGREFLEFGTLLNASVGGALLAIRKPLRRWSRVSLEMPSTPLLMNVKLPRAVRTVRARVVRITYVNDWKLCGLQFAHPLV